MRKIADLLYEAETFAWAVMGPWFAQHKGIIQTTEFGLSFSCVLAALFAGGNLMAAAIALFLGWVLSTIGLLSIESYSIRRRETLSVFAASMFVLFFFAIHSYHSDDVSFADFKHDVARILQAQKDDAPRQKLLENPASLVPADDYSKKSICNNEYNVCVGGIDFGAEAFSFPFTAIVVMGAPYLTVSLDKDQGIVVSFDLFNERGQILANVQDNKIFIPPMQRSYVQARKDLNSLEVRDEFGKSRMYIKYLNRHFD